MNRRADRRPTVSTRYQESARGAKAYLLMKFPFYSKKKRLIVGCLETFIVVLLCCYFLRPQPSLPAPKKPIPGVQIVATVKRKAAEKNVVARERREETLVSPNSFLSLFFPSALHCLNRVTSNRLVPEVTRRSTKKIF